jgi:peptidoglycan/xylan/chitin deacetylase (PgdA/CDA1 family)
MRLPPVRRAVRRARPQAVVLMYHRIAAVDSDVFDLAVRPERFREQMEVIAAGCRPMHVTELAAAATRGTIPRRAVAVTVDDGYVDTATEVLPVLRATGVPGTVFVVSGSVGSTAEYWWDELEHLAIDPVPGPPLELTVGEQPIRLGGDRAAHRSGFDRLHRAMLPLSSTEQAAVLERIATWRGVPRPQRPGYRVMTAEELDAVASDPLVEVGAHTVTHAHLPSRSDDEIGAELQDSKAWLAARVGGAVDALSYPYGAYDERSLRAAAAAGFTAAVTIDLEPVPPGADPLRLGRFAATDWDAEAFARRLDELFVA